MDETERIINEIRNYTEMEKDNVMVQLKKTSAIRLIDYIDKIEDENILLMSMLNRNIEVNINNK